MLVILQRSLDSVAKDSRGWALLCPHRACSGVFRDSFYSFFSSLVGNTSTDCEKMLSPRKGVTSAAHAVRTGDRLTARLNRLRTKVAEKFVLRGRDFSRAVNESNKPLERRR